MKHLPNLLTLGNAVAGVMAIYFIQNQITSGLAAALIIAAIFDALDGWVARKVGVAGPLGKQLDSLADAISFGATAGFLWSNILFHGGRIEQPWAILIGGFVTASSVLRLAKFNLDTDQTTDFKGMPTPANALFALGIWSYLNSYEVWDWTIKATEGQQQLLTAVLLLGAAWVIYWQNASFRVMSLKEGGSKNRKWAQYGLGAIFIALFPFLGALAISIVVFLLPVTGYLVKKVDERS